MANITSYFAGSTVKGHTVTTGELPAFENIVCEQYVPATQNTGEASKTHHMTLTRLAGVTGYTRNFVACWLEV